mgnify:CR=1 FL=1
MQKTRHIIRLFSEYAVIIKPIYFDETDQSFMQDTILVHGKNRKQLKRQTFLAPVTTTSLREFYLNYLIEAKNENQILNN